jgi:hypothetical protein
LGACPQTCYNKLKKEKGKRSWIISLYEWSLIVGGKTHSGSFGPNKKSSLLVHSNEGYIKNNWGHKMLSLGPLLKCVIVSILQYKINLIEKKIIINLNPNLLKKNPTFINFLI